MVLQVLPDARPVGDDRRLFEKLCLEGFQSGLSWLTILRKRENFRAAPSGVILAEVMADTELPLGERQDRWRQATLEGWVWGASVREEAQDGHDLVITAAAGENLRSVPNGPILARLREGMRLDRVETRGRWVLVRRSGWVWEPSLEVLESEPTPPPVPPGTPRATTGGADATDPGRAGTPAADAPEAGAGRREFTISGRNGSMLLENPAGDTLARIAPGASVQVLAREGAWARVRVLASARWWATGVVRTPTARC